MYRWERNKLSVTIASFMSTYGLACAAMGQTEIEEVIVTAQKRNENLQDVTLSVQVIDAKTLNDDNIKTFKDYVSFLPNVNAGGRGPGQQEIYIRGVAVDAVNIAAAEAQGVVPNVALYLDEQAITAGGRNLDIFITDAERIEVLPGPQGTLYGASSQAGTVRIITNKPELDTFDANISADLSQTAHGKSSQSIETMINVPFNERIAARLALYRVNQGGYIDNVSGEFVADPTQNPTFPNASGHIYTEDGTFADGTQYSAGHQVPVSYETATNENFVEDDFNDASYQGGRLGIKAQLTDEWSALAQYTQQTLKTEGVFDYDPEVGDLAVSRFSEDQLEDNFKQAAWTLEGTVSGLTRDGGLLEKLPLINRLKQLEELHLIYTGAYFKRDVYSVVDYTGYTNGGGFISGYQCEYLVGASYNGLDSATAYQFDPTLSGDPNVIECGSPVNSFIIDNENTRFNQELRLSTDPKQLIRVSGGLFYDNSETRHIGNFNYFASAEAGFSPIDIRTNPALDQAASNARNQVNTATQFRNDIIRTEEQYAVFGEFAFDLGHHITLSLAARYYDLDIGFSGNSAWRYGNRPIFTDDDDLDNDIRPDVTGGRDYGALLKDLEPLKVDDTIKKLSLSWQPSNTQLYYFSFSEGYRPPGFNRAAAAGADPDTNPDGVPARNAGQFTQDTDGDGVNDSAPFPDYHIPFIYNSDALDSYELGWKTEFFGRKLRFNGALYHLDWQDIQVSHFDPQNISIFTIVDNGGDAAVNGLEFNAIWRAIENLTLFGAASYNDTELTAINEAFSFVVADLGSELPLTPRLQFNAKARYEFKVNYGYNAYCQIGTKYAGESYNSLVDTPSDPRQRQDSYTLFDGAIGMQKDNWQLELYAQNLTDERAPLHINRQDFIQRITTNRPRTIGLKMTFSID